MTVYARVTRQVLILAVASLGAVIASLWASISFGFPLIATVIIVGIAGLLVRFGSAALLRRSWKCPTCGNEFPVRWTRVIVLPTPTDVCTRCGLRVP